MNGLGSLGQHAAGLARLTDAKGLRQIRTARQHSIGALLALNGQNQPTHDHSALPYIHPANGPGDLNGAGNVGLVAGLRGYRAQHADR